MREGGNQAHSRKKKEEHIDRFKLFLHTRINTMHEFSFTCNAVCVHAICEGLLEDSAPLMKGFIQTIENETTKGWIS